MQSQADREHRFIMVYYDVLQIRTLETKRIDEDIDIKYYRDILYWHVCRRGVKYKILFREITKKLSLLSDDNKVIST